MNGGGGIKSPSNLSVKLYGYDNVQIICKCSRLVAHIEKREHKRDQVFSKKEKNYANGSHKSTKQLSVSNAWNPRHRVQYSRTEVLRTSQKIVSDSRERKGHAATFCHSKVPQKAKTKPNHTGKCYHRC
ncbi:hypothetical protein NPIL_248771 [Nephila pilipes]|uniref:Uncharacterized protein n=1 Tax=Nephila pilipes TaxID=299642 RepID=A0A8X6TL81_NEPPI|nr:hypothetical protein NPIL_248771 [Nephila pilipes]